MRIHVWLGALALPLLATTVRAAPPVAVSPGDPDAATRVASPCPTFSWSLARGGDGYRLAVWALSPEAETSAPAAALEIELPAGVGGWTPSGDGCLAPGGRYAWAVRSEGGNGTEAWSEPLFFEVAAAPGPAEVGAALEVLRRYLAAGGELDGLIADPDAELAAATGDAGGPAAPDAAPPTPSVLATPDATGLTSEIATTTGEITFGVHGLSHSSDAGSAGTVGVSTAASGDVAGIYGQTASADGAAGVFDNTAAGDILRGLANGTELFTVAGDGNVTAASFAGDGSALTSVPVGAHTHSGADVTSGTVADSVIDADLARDAEVFGLVTAADGSGSTLDADLLDGMDSAAFLAASADPWVDETGDTMSGKLTLDPASGFALETGSGDDVNLKGELYMDSTLFLHNRGTTSVGLGQLALTNNTGSFNTAVGHGTLTDVTTGGSNTAFGGFALYNTTGQYNTGVGAAALQTNTAGDANTAIGFMALSSSTTASHNTAVGNGALTSNTTGQRDVAVGSLALSLSSTASDNTAVGFEALRKATSGDENVAIGSYAMTATTTGNNSVALGVSALRANTTGEFNTAVGRNSMRYNISGQANVAVGSTSLYKNTTGLENTALGVFALTQNTTGRDNAAGGHSALKFNTTSDYSTAFGSHALFVSTGARNTALGYGAGRYATTGSDNIFLGAAAKSVAGESNTIRIGGTTVGAGSNQQNRTFINGIWGVTTANSPAINVMIDSAGQLGTVSSSRRFKEEIEPMGELTDKLLDLRPVTFRYKRDGGPPDPDAPLEYGLIAEEVAEVFPDLVVYDEAGEPFTVRYHLLSSILLNELQHEHAALVEQRRRLAAQEVRLEELAERLRAR